jgi:polygalacturonase
LPRSRVPHLISIALVPAVTLGIAGCRSASVPSTPVGPSAIAGAGAMFSNPAAVKLPTFPALNCPVAAGASTAQINAIIASCSGAGGGTVSFAPGAYSVGSIHLMSNVRLLLNGATLTNGGGIDEPEPYPSPIVCSDDGHQHWHNALVWGENISNVALVGPGSLDGGGLRANGQKMIALRSSRLIQFDNLTQSNTGHFAYLLTDCHDVTMSRLTIRPRRDGVDLMQCTNVNAHDLSITGGSDDAFALKSDCATGKPMVTDNITISNSTLGSGCNALQIGSETWGDFQNISWSNIEVIRGAKSGIGIQTNDGAVIRNMSYDNIRMTNVSFPIFINETSLLRAPQRRPGHVENIHIRNVTATGIVAGNNKSPQDSAIVISGEPDSPHQGIFLEKVRITFPGGGAPSDDPPEGSTLTGRAAYNPRFINPIPAYGLYVRHARDVRLHDVTFSLGAPEQRPAVAARDVTGLLLDAFTAPNASVPALQLEAVMNLGIRNSTPLRDVTLSVVEKTTL